MSIACPCCGLLTLCERGASEICPVCFWEDDGQSDLDAEEVFGGPNGPLSLAIARRNYVQFGASDQRFVGQVRDPQQLEHPE